MNFLQLAQSLRQECGVAGTGPTTTAGQVGQAKKLVDWTNQAWLEIQGKHDTWGFMREPFSFEIAQGVDSTTPATAGLSDLRYWHRDTVRCYKTALGFEDEQWLVEWEYQVFRNTYRFNVQVNGRPVVFAIKPNGKAVMLGQIPDDVYQISGEYQTLPTSMTADADVPAAPTHLHLAIVYKAMQFYGLFEAAPEVLSKGNTEFSRLMNQLEREQLPELYLGNPLA
jgi:hypothetical protein